MRKSTVDLPFSIALLCAFAACDVCAAEFYVAPAGEVPDFLHKGREAGDGPRPQIIPIGEPARQDDAVHALQIMILVPQADGGLFQDVLEGMDGVHVAVRTGKGDDSEFHGASSLSPRGSAR